MNQILVVREAILFLEQKTQDRGTGTNTNYKLAMKDLITHLFPPKALQCQKRYLRRGVYKYYKKNQNFICRVEEMVEYLEKLLPCGIN